jgi:putative ABC transport system permease protein
MRYRYWDQGSNMKDELDGVDIRLRADADSIEVAKIVTAVLNSNHHGVQDFTVTIPAALLAQQKRTQTIFTYVMVAIAAISLLVGGIGIMNIVLATVMERTREIGIRRSIGARRFDIVRQFLTESVLISVGGGLLGIAFGFFLAWLIARTAEWKTIVTSSSVIIAFGVVYNSARIQLSENARELAACELHPCIIVRTASVADEDVVLFAIATSD